MSTIQSVDTTSTLPKLIASLKQKRVVSSRNGSESSLTGGSYLNSSTSGSLTQDSDSSTGDASASKSSAMPTAFSEGTQQTTRAYGKYKQNLPLLEHEKRTILVA